MSLLVYNLTAAPLVLANGLSTTIPASTAGAGARGEPWYASGDELNGRSGAEYLALQAQQDAGDVTFQWQSYEEYPTPGLSILPYAVGPLIVAAATIAPTTLISHVTGATVIKTITPPWSNFEGDLTLIPDDVGGFATDTGGNIAKATAATQFRALKMTFDGTSWYPSYN
jgi:hypothetical protein